MCTKCEQNSQCLNSLGKSLNFNAGKYLNTALIASKLTYCALTWSWNDNTRRKATDHAY